MRGTTPFRRWAVVYILAVLLAVGGGLTGTIILAADDTHSVAVVPSGELSRGEALAVNVPIPTRDLLGMVRDGGIMMIPLGICSLVLLSFVFERTVSLRHGRIIPKPFVKRFIAQIREGELKPQDALELCEENNSPVAKVFAGAVRKWGRPAVEIEQAIIDTGERVTTHLRSYLRVINAVATVSPLLGLLGTVVGMITAFNAIATSDALGRPELLAGGISQALLTTAAGLCVAIPAYICYLFFVSRVDQLIIEIDSLGQELVCLISAEEMPVARQKSRTTKSTQTKRRGTAA